MSEWVSIVDIASDWNWNRRVCHLSQSKQVENRCIVTVWKHHLSLRERVMHKNSPFWYQKPKNFLGRGHSPLPTPLGAFGASEPRAFGARLPAPQVLPPSYAYACWHIQISISKPEYLRPYRLIPTDWQKSYIVTALVIFYEPVHKCSSTGPLISGLLNYIWGLTKKIAIIMWDKANLCMLSLLCTWCANCAIFWQTNLRSVKSWSGQLAK